MEDVVVVVVVAVLLFGLWTRSRNERTQDLTAASNVFAGGEGTMTAK